RSGVKDRLAVWRGVALDRANAARNRANAVVTHQKIGVRVEWPKGIAPPIGHGAAGIGARARIDHGIVAPEKGGACRQSLAIAGEAPARNGEDLGASESAMRALEHERVTLGRPAGAGTLAVYGDAPQMCEVALSGPDQGIGGSEGTNEVWRAR